MKNVKIFFFFLLLCSSCKTHAGLINIEIVNKGGLSASQASLYDSAVNFWESFLIGTQEDIDVNLQIIAQGSSIDGVGNILGQAGPRQGIFHSNGVYVTLGVMEFDTADLNAYEQAGLLFDIIVHEMGHVIGFGTIWSFFNGLYEDGTGEYNGKYALEAYREEFDASATFVPVDIVSRPGTRDGHWAEDWAGPQSDLLTGFLEGPTTISNTTLASFADIGYVVQLPNGKIIGRVNAPTMLSMFILFSFFAIRRRKLKL